MRIVLDTERCTGHGRCYSLAPALFDADDEGRPVVLDGGSDRAAALVAAGNCPEQAIAVGSPR